MSEHDARSIPYFLWKGRFVKESGKFLEDRRKSRKFSIKDGYTRELWLASPLLFSVLIFLIEV